MKTIETYFMTDGSVSAMTIVKVNEYNNEAAKEIAYKAWQQLIDQESYEKQLGSHFNQAYLVDAWKIFDEIIINGIVIPKNDIDSPKLIENLFNDTYAKASDKYSSDLIELFNKKVRAKYNI